MNTTDFGQLIKAHPEILDSPKTFAAFLRDIYPTEKGNVNLMITAYNAGVVSMLHSSALDSLLTARIMTLLVDDYSISEERARWAAELWISAYAFSIGRTAQVKPQRVATTQSQTSAQPTVSTPVQRTSTGGSGRDRKPVADFFTKIVGVTHNNTGANTENRQNIIQELKNRGQLEPGQALTLELDTENRWSENAVKVIAPDGRQLGYLSQTVADKNAPQMRDGYEYQAFVSAVTGGENGFVYGVNIRIVVHEPVQSSSVVHQDQTQAPRPSSDKSVSNPPVPTPTQKKRNKKSLLSRIFKTEDIMAGCCITKYLGPERRQIVIPEYINERPVASIGDGVFEGYTGLTNIIIPDGVKTIGERAFKGCTGLTEVTIPNGVTIILAHTFAKCSSLTHITIPSGVKEIKWSAFQGCSSLTRIDIPQSITTIGIGAFVGCNRLTIYAPAGSFAEFYAKQNNISFYPLQTANQPYSQVRSTEIKKRPDLNTTSVSIEQKSLICPKCHSIVIAFNGKCPRCDSTLSVENQLIFTPGK